MNTAKALVATLFVTLFMMAIPVHADMKTGWKPYTEIDKMTDLSRKWIFTGYMEKNKRFTLARFCQKGTVFVVTFEGFGSFGKEYDESNHNDLLVRFDKLPAYYINVRKIAKYGLAIVHTDSFLSKIRKHQTLLAKFQIWPDGYIIAEFDISGFDDVYEKHCN